MASANGPIWIYSISMTRFTLHVARGVELLLLTTDSFINTRLFSFHSRSVLVQSAPEGVVHVLQFPLACQHLEIDEFRGASFAGFKFWNHILKQFPMHFWGRPSLPAKPQTYVNIHSSCKSRETVRKARQQSAHWKHCDNVGVPLFQYAHATCGHCQTHCQLPLLSQIPQPRWNYFCPQWWGVVSQLFEAHGNDLHEIGH